MLAKAEPGFCVLHCLAIALPFKAHLFVKLPCLHEMICGHA